MSLAGLTLFNSTPALAFSGAGAGTSISPYQVTTCVQLNSIELDLTAYYVLANDVDCDGVTWAPISAFTGTLDGQNHKISNLDLSGTPDTTDLVGMFSTIRNTAVVKNLVILNGKANGQADIGMVAGAMFNTSSLDNVYAQATVTCRTDRCGGLVGSLRNANLINDSGADVNVTNDGQTAGGLIGWIADNATVSKSFANGYVTGTYYVGGIVGAVNNGGAPATITNSYANATVVAINEYAGGIAGLGVKLNLTNSYATGSVTGVDNLGGLVGMHMGDMAETFAASAVNGTGGAVGPVTGVVIPSGTYGNRYFDTNISGFSSSPDGSSAITNSDYFINNSTNPPMSTWNFSTMWRTNYADYPSFAPKIDPYMLCEAPQSTDTTITGHCLVAPLGWGTPTWEARWSVRNANSWHSITLNDIHQARATVSGLTPGTWYDLQFRYTNNFGTGPWGTQAILTTGTAPVVPVTTASQRRHIPFHYVAATPTPVTDDTATTPFTPTAAQDTTPAKTTTKTNPTTVSVNWLWLGGVLTVFIVVGLFVGFGSRKV